MTPLASRVRGRSSTVLLATVAVGFAALVSACAVAAAGGADRTAERATTTSTTTSTTTTSTSTTTTTTSTSTTTTTTTTAPPATTTPPVSASPDDRDHVLTGFAPYATVGGVTLHHPVAVVEIIGFHQSNHEGALDQIVVEGTTWAVELNTRGRATSPRTSADIVSQPETEVRSPVTGTVVRASRYNLYCSVDDEFMVVVPDENPALEVKLLHVRGLTVAAGQRVIAGETVVAHSAHLLPFVSQVDRLTADPSWPHVHVEVIDPSIPNVPNGGTGSSEDC